jgi:hypothetical protein
VSTIVDDSTWERFLDAHTELGRPTGPLEFSDEELHVAIGEARKRWFRHMLEMQYPWGDPIHPDFQADPGVRAEEVAKALRDPEPGRSRKPPWGSGLYPVSKSDVGRVVARLMRLEREGVVSRNPSPWGSLWRSEADQEEEN